MTQTLYRRDFYSGIELRSVTDSPDYTPHFHDAYTIGLLTRGGQYGEQANAEASFIEAARKRKLPVEILKPGEWMKWKANA